MKIKRRNTLAVALCLLGAMSACQRESEPTSPSTSSSTAPASQRAAPQGPIRLAIVELPSRNDSAGGPARAAVHDLLTAKLSEAEGFELVERAAMDSIVRELSLSMSSLAKASDVMRVGRMLKADWLLLLSYPAGTADAVLSKVVETTTGAVRDIQMIPVKPEDPTGTAAAIAKFAAAARTARTPMKDRLWIGLGAFEDLGLNRRYKDFPERLRTALGLKLAGSRVSLVERRHVRPLLEEWRLAQAGFLGSSPGTNQAQHAFVLVDGIYQAFQDERSAINLVLRMEWIDGRQHVVSLKEAPGAEMERKVIEAIDRFLVEPRGPNLNSNRVIRRTEAQAQLRRAYELSGMPGGYYEPADGLVYFPTGIQDRGTRLRDAISAFESALFLQPDHLEARFALAGCLANPLVNRVEEARDIWREIAAATTKPNAVNAARSALAASYFGRDNLQALELLMALQTSTTNSAIQARLPHRIARVRRDLGLQVEPAEKSPAFDVEAWRAECRLTERQLAESGQVRRINETFVFPASKYRPAPAGENASAARIELLGTVVSNLALEFPRLEPYLTVTHALRDMTSGYWQERLRDTVARFAKEPESIPDPKAFMSFLTDEFRSGHFHKNSAVSSLSYEMARALERWGDKYLGAQMTKDDVNFAIGSLYVRDRRWDEAIPIFERIGSRQVSPFQPDNPLWRKLTSISGQRAAEICRQERDAARGLAVAPPKYLKPMRVFPGAEVRFRFDRDQMWIGDRNAYYQYDPAHDSLQEVSLPFNRRVRDIAVGFDRVWFGTAQGLYGVDRRDRSVLTNGIEQGLLSPSVTRLLVDRDRLWIGFGIATNWESAGGMGYLKLPENRFVGFMPELSQQRLTGIPETIQPIAGQPHPPPTSYVTGLSRSAPDTLWMTSSSRLFRHEVGSGRWETAIPQLSGAVAKNVVANDDHVVVVCREVEGRSSTYTNYGGVFVYSIKAKSYRRLGLEDGLPNTTVSEVALDGSDVWLGGQGYVAKLHLPSLRVEKAVPFQSSHQIESMEVHGQHVWFSAGPALFRLPRTGEVEATMTPALSEAADVADLPSARQLLRKMGEAYRVYGNRENEDYLALQSKYRGFLRRAAQEFPLVKLANGAKSNRFRRYMMNARGRGYDGFRFKNSREQPADFGWVFAHEHPSSFLRWQILPMEDAPWTGFTDYRSPKIAYTNAPWSGLDRSFNPILQFLSNDQLMPGKEYILWLEYGDVHPTPLFMAFELFPAATRIYDRAVLEESFGLQGPPIPNAY